MCIIICIIHTTHRNAFTIRYRHHVRLKLSVSISLVQDMVIVDVMKPQNNYTNVFK